MLSADAVPVSLRGSYKSTRAAWRRIATRAWEEGSWAHALADVECVSMWDTVGPIIVWNDDRLLESTCRPIPLQFRRETWQLNWILEVPMADGVSLMMNGTKHRRLLEEAMGWIWGALGVLQADSRKLPFLWHMLYSTERDEYSMEERVDIVRSFARAFVRQIDSLVKLDQRISIASGRPSHGIQRTGLSRRLTMIAEAMMLSGAMTSEEALSVVTGSAAASAQTLRTAVEQWGRA